MKDKKSNILPFLPFLIFSLIFTSPLLLSKNNLGIQDWDQYLAYLESARISLIQYRQFPFWNPYHCGGMPNFANPQSHIFSLTFLFILIFGTIMGVKISIFFHHLIAQIGLFFLARYYRLSTAASLFAALVFSFSGVISSALGVGMLQFISAAYLPFTWLTFLIAINNKSITKRIKYSLITALLLSLKFYAGYQIVLIFFPFLIIPPLSNAFKQKSLTPLFLLTLIVGLFIIFSSPKLFLSIKLMTNNPRPINDFSGQTFKEIFLFLISKSQNYHKEMAWSNFTYGVDENSLYIGLIPFFFLLVGIVRERRNFNLIIPLGVSLLLMVGNRYQYGLFNILTTLPFFNFFRVAQRFRFIFIIFASIFIGYGFDKFYKSFLDKKKRQVTASFIILIVFFDLFIFSADNFYGKAFILRPPPEVKNNNINQSFHLRLDYPVNYEYDSSTVLPDTLKFNHAYLPWSNEYVAMKNNIGIINCYEPIPVKKAAQGKDQPEYKGEAYFLPSNEKARITYWSPNKIKIEIPPRRNREKIIINQNYDSYWFVFANNKNKKAENYSGLISFSLSGEKTITFIYNPFISFFIL